MVEKCAVYMWAIDCGEAKSWRGGGGRSGGIARGLQVTHHPWILNRQEDKRLPTRLRPARWSRLIYVNGPPCLCMLSRRYMPPCTPRGLVGTRACVSAGVFVLFSALSDVRLTDSIHSADTARCVTISLGLPGESVCVCVCLYMCVFALSMGIWPPSYLHHPCMFVFTTRATTSVPTSLSTGRSLSFTMAHTRAHIWPPALDTG